MTDEKTPRRGPSAGRKQPITVDAIVEAAFTVVEGEGFDALTMRRVAGVLETGPASLYAHVVNKSDLDELLIGRICAEISLPKPNPRSWRRQTISVCTQLRDEYLRYPGISLAAMSTVATNADTLRVSEGLLSLVLAGGATPQRAVWAVDMLLLYVNAFCLELSLRDKNIERSDSVDPDTMARRFAALPDTFPTTRRLASEMTSGTPEQRFDFSVNLVLDGLAGA